MSIRSFKNKGEDENASDKALGGSPQFWLNLHNHWELSQVDGTSFEDIQPIAAEAH